MKGFKIPTTCLLFGSVAMGSLVTREFRQKEELILADCGIGTLPDKGASSSRQMAYYAAGRNPQGGNNPWVKPDMIAGVPWDGSYPWRGSGVSTKFSNGDVFQVWINSAIKDWDESKSYAGDAVHTYDPNGFKCWAEHSKPVFTLADGTRCTSAYICWHEPKGSGSSGSGDTNKPPTKYVTKPEFTMSSKDVSVRVQGTTQDENNWNPTRAFSHIHDAIEGVQCRKQAYAIGNDCSISFDCTFTLPDQTGPLTKILTDAVAPAVVGTKTTKKGHYAGKCPPQGGPCDPGYDFTWTEYEYPMTGKVLVSVYPEGNPGASSLQSEIGWSVECKNSGFCGAFCHNNGVHIANVASNIAGVVPVGSVICMFC